TVTDPWAQPLEPAEVEGQRHLVNIAMHDCRRIAPQRIATDERDVAVDLGMRSEFDVAEHREHIAIDRTVDVHIAEESPRRVAHRTCDARVAEYGYDAIAHDSFDRG